MKAAVPSPITIAFSSLFISVIVLGTKYAAFALTGSVALYSDALESIINVATAAAAIVAIRVAARPADDDHPYGHHKAEYLTAVGVGALIIIAAFAIMHEAYMGFMHPKPMDAPLLGLCVSSIATLLNVGWSHTLITYGKRHKSAALGSDGKHLMSDVYTSIGVLVGVMLAVATGIMVLDSLIAALVALHVLYNGWEVIRDNASGLLDESVPPAELKKIRKIIKQHLAEAIEFHDLRTRHAGRATFIEFHLVVSGQLSVSRAHDICDDLESALNEAIPDSQVTIHVEPEHKAKHI